MKSLSTLLIALAITVLTVFSGVAEDKPVQLNVSQLSKITAGLNLNAEQTKSWVEIQKKTKESIEKSKAAMPASPSPEDVATAVAAMKVANEKAESELVALLDADQLESFKASRAEVSKTQGRMTSKPSQLQ